MSSISSEEIISILKSEIENYELETKDQEVGTVIWISDGITTVYGIDHAMYGEIVIFETGVKGMVQDIRRNEIGVILLGKDTGIKEGTKVTRTGKKAGIPVGDAYLGRVVDALGAPIDGKGDIPSDGYRPIEQEAPGIIDRKSVSVPLETGILAIDSMFPIGRGQRELIIGDRQVRHLLQQIRSSTKKEKMLSVFMLQSDRKHLQLQKLYQLLQKMMPWIIRLLYLRQRVILHRYNILHRTQEQRLQSILCTKGKMC